MKYEEISFASANGVDTVAASIWIPDMQQPKAILQIAHGMCEHMGRYEDFAQFMARNGFVVCGQDHIGHGRTAATDDDLGFFAEKDGHVYLVEDVGRLRGIISERYPELPYFLLGHSMGSFITRQYITKHAKGISGYICCGTGGPMPILSIAIAYTKWQRMLKGSRARGYAVNKIAFGAAYKNPGKKAKASENINQGQTGDPNTVPQTSLTKPSYSSHAWLSRDPAVWEAFGSDPKCNYVFTNAGFLDMFTLYRNVSTVSWTRAVPKDLPVFLIAGDKDPVGNRGSGVKIVNNRLRFAGIYDLTMKLYKDARHELLNETNKAEVYDDILQWMLAKIPASQ